MKRMFALVCLALFYVSVYAKKKDLHVSGSTEGCAPINISYGINFKNYARLKWEIPKGVKIEDVSGFDNLLEEFSMEESDSLISLEMYGYFKRKLKIVYIHQNKQDSKTIKRKSNLFFTQNEMRSIDLLFLQGGEYQTLVSGKFGILGLRGSRSKTKTASIINEDVIFDPQIILLDSKNGDTITCGDEVKLSTAKGSNVTYKWSIPQVNSAFTSDSTIFMIPSEYTIGENPFLQVYLERNFLCGSHDSYEKTIYIDRKLEEKNTLQGIELEGTTRKDTINCGDVASLYTTESKYVNYKWSITNFENDFHETSAKIYIPSEYSYTESSFLLVNLKRDFLCGTDDLLTKVIQIDKFVEKPKLFANSKLVTDTTKIFPDCNNEISFEIKGINRQLANYSWQFSESWISPNNTSNGFNLYEGVGLNSIKVKNVSSLPSKGYLNVSMTSRCSAGQIREIDKYITLYSKGGVSTTNPNLVSESCDTAVNYITSVGLHIPYSIKWNSENNTGHFAFNTINSSGFNSFSNSFIVNNFYEGKLFATIKDSLGCVYKDSIQVKILGKSDNNDVSGWFSQEIKSDVDYSVLTNFTYGGDLPYVYFLDSVTNTIKYFEKLANADYQNSWRLNNTNIQIQNKKSNLTRENDNLFYVNSNGNICFREINFGELGEEIVLKNTKTSTKGDDYLILEKYGFFVILVYLDLDKNLILSRNIYDKYKKEFTHQSDTVLVPFQQNPENGVIGGLSKASNGFYYWKTDSKLYKRGVENAYYIEKEITEDKSIDRMDLPKVVFDNHNNLYYNNLNEIVMINLKTLDSKSIVTSPIIQDREVQVDYSTGSLYYRSANEIYQLYRSENFKSDSTFLTIKSSAENNHALGYLSLNKYGIRNPLFKTMNHKIGELTYSYKEGICFQPKYFKTTTEFEEIQPKLYPNPVEDKLRLNFENKIEHLRISNSFGKVVFETRSVFQEIDLTQLPNGIYIIEVQEENKVPYIQRIEKK